MLVRLLFWIDTIVILINGELIDEKRKLIELFFFFSISK